MLKLNKLVIRFAFLGVMISGLGAVCLTALPDNAQAAPLQPMPPLCEKICRETPNGLEECPAKAVLINNRWVCKAIESACIYVRDCGTGGPY